MKDYISEAPEFSEVLRIIETSDLVNAEVPNVALKQLFHNTLCNRHWIERLEKSTGDVGEYDTETAYTRGDYCLWQGILYECVQDTTGEWDPDCWKRTSAIEEINGLKIRLDELKEWFTRLFDGFAKPIKVTIPASGWSSAAPFTNHVEIEGIREKDNVDVTFIPAEGATNEENIAAWDGYVNINYTTTEDGAMVFHAFETKPEVDVTVAVKGMVQWEEEEPENPEGTDTPDPPEGPTDPGNTDTPEITDTPENQDDV